MTTFNGTIAKIEVKDNDKTATVQTNTAEIFKVTNDNVSSFEAMMSVLSLARLVSFPVTIEHGPDNEINKLTF